ncbi:hypothetical protein FQN60_016195, partial [Etheostoma spectabile]
MTMSSHCLKMPPHSPDLNPKTTIPRCELDPADRLKTVDLMLSCDRQEAVNRTRESLGKIQRNDLVERLTATQ